MGHEFFTFHGKFMGLRKAMKRRLSILMAMRMNFYWDFRETTIGSEEACEPTAQDEADE